MYTVKEVSKLPGISVRTLHHYHAIGLLKPRLLSPAGYRLYGQDALQRLSQILMFRELGFPLAEIKAILDSPGFRPQEALTRQLKLLECQRRHLDELIAHARALQEQGGDFMDFQAFQSPEQEQYAREAKERWGSTPAYQEYVRRNVSEGDLERDLMGLFAELGKLRELSPSSPEAQRGIHRLQDFISERCYPCTDEILRGLGEMYVSDPRMRNNIDRAGGPGTASFVSRAIQCM